MFQSHSQEFRYGKYLGIKNGLEQETKMFKYEILTDKDYQYSSVARNLITTKESIGIRTSYQLGWKINGIVELQDGCLYLIRSIKSTMDWNAPQVNSIVKNSGVVLHYLELLKMVRKNG